AAYVDPRQPPSPHTLPLRSARHPRAAGHQAAPRPPLPHADRKLLAQGDAGAALRELAAGSERKLARTLRLSGEDPRIHHHGRSHRRHGGDKTVLLFLRPLPRKVPVRLFPRTRPGASPLSPCPARRPAAGARPPPRLPPPHKYRRFPGRTQSTSATRNPLSDPHGNRRADAGANAKGKFGLVSGQRMVAGANPATFGARGPVRVGLPHSVATRHALARRAGWRG